MCTTDVVYETNDDYGISQELVAGYPYVGFVNFFLCKILIPIQRMFPAYNIFVISQIIMSFIALTVILKVIIEKSDGPAEILLATLVCAFISFDHYSAVQFTKTAGLLVSAGALQLVDNYLFKRKLPSYVLGYALLYIGVAYRQKSMTPAIAYAFCFLLLWMLINGKELYKGKSLLKELITLTVLLTLALAPYGFDKLSDSMNESSEELRYAREYQAERRKITDYPIMSYYEENEDKYDEIGISLNDLSMINRWMFDYDGAASMENLKKINAINAVKVKESKSLFRATKKALKGAMESLMSMDFLGMQIIIALGLSLFILCRNRGKYLVYVLAFGALSIALYIAVYYMQRVQYRALFIPNESILIWLLYTAVTGEKKEGKALRYVALVAVCAVIVLMVKPAIGRLDSMKAHNEGKLESEAVLEYFDQHKQYFYIGPTSTMRQPHSFITPLLTPSIPENVSGTGGWETLTPYKLSFLNNYAVNNPIKDLIDREDVLFFGNYKKDMIKEYLEKWYCDDNEEINFIKVDEIEENEIYKIQKNVIR